MSHPHSTSLGRYIALVLGGTALLLGLVTLFNALVDPFGMYRIADIEGLNRNKPAITHRVRLLKAYEVRRVRPTSLVLGSSRVHVGIRPSHPALSRDGARVYNLAFDGATTKEMYYYLLHAHAVSPLKHVLLGLDAYHPTTAPATMRPGFDASYLMRSPGAWSRIRILLADLKLLTSFDTLKESIATLRQQNDPEPRWLAPDGQRLGDVFFREVERDFIARGPRDYFDQVDQMEVGFKLEWRIPGPAVAAAPRGPGESRDPATSIDYIGRIVEFCRGNRIDLKIFFTPAHVHQEELSAATGGADLFSNAKRAMVQLLERDRVAHPDAPPIPLYDFGGYNSVTMEALPPPGSRQELAGYWDSSHFKSEVGDRVLDRLLGVEDESRPLPADFGVLLTGGNVESGIQEQVTRQSDYRRSHADQVRQLELWVESYKREHGIKD